MIQVEEIWASFNEYKSYGRIQPEINKFLKESKIERDRLIDIKYISTGGGEFTQQGRTQALIIYETEE